MAAEQHDRAGDSQVSDVLHTAGGMTPVPPSLQMGKYTTCRARCLIKPWVRPVARGGIPAMTDIRLPNPLDLKLFDKAWLLGRGRMQVEAVGW
jgi:hypothetical protein